MDKRIKAAIENVLRERPDISTDEAVEIVRMYAEKPDPTKLEDQYYRRMANRILAGFRDDKHVRECFNIKTQDGGRLYINVPQTTNKTYLEIAKKTLASKYRGLNKSLKKIQSRELEVAGQMAMDFGEQRENAQ